MNSSNSSFMLGDYNEFGTSNKELVEFNIWAAFKGERPHMIDEWQEVPGIWDAVRSEVDRTSVKGSFILTGSSVPRVKRPMHSGAGRIKHLRIRTMSLYESGDSTGEISLKAIMSGEDIPMVDNMLTLESLVELISAGGWPGNLNLDYEAKMESVRGYLETIMDSAAHMDDRIRKESGLWMVFRSIARNETTLASNKKIQNDTGLSDDSTGSVASDSLPVSYDSVTDYLDVFDRLYLIDDVLPFNPNLKSSVRVGKTKKRHLVDPSLAVAALGVGKERLMRDLTVAGCMFESLCLRDLRIYSQSIGARVFHYRDDSNMEVDAIVEMEDGTWGVFEIKLGFNQVEEAVRNLKKFRDKMSDHHAERAPAVLGVICGMTRHSFRTEDGVYVFPITALRP